MILLLLASQIGALGQGPGGFGGPSIQGRGGGGARRRSDGVRIRPYLGVQASYNTGLTSIIPGPDGSIFTDARTGVEVNYGLYGTKQWKRNQTQLSYSGDYRSFSGPGNFGGSNQSLDLSHSTVLTKRWNLDGSVSAGTVNQAFGGSLQPNFNDLFLNPGLPANSLFDIRTNFLSANGGLTYTISPRTSVSFTGGGYVVSRRNLGLFSVNGITAKADVARRINKRTTVGVDYNFLTFQFSRAFGDTYIHGLSGYLSRQFGRSWELNARLGAMKLEVLASRQVAIDPVIAEIIGVSIGSEVSYSNLILGSGSLALTRTSRQGTFSVQASRTVNPGNGLILTAQADQGTIGYNRRLSRQLNVDTSYNYARLRGLGLITGRFVNHGAGLGLGWQVSRWAQIVARYDRRNTVTDSASRFGLNGNRFSAGVLFTPSDLPVSLW